MPDAARRLLEHLVRTRLQPLDRQQVELTATAENTADVPGDVQRLAERERGDAHDLADAFAAGLARAAAQRDQALTLDDRDPDENRMADALIRFLVKPDLARVASEEVAPQHYRYHLTVDWLALATVADEAGVLLHDLTSG